MDATSVFEIFKTELVDQLLLYVNRITVDYQGSIGNKEYGVFDR